MIVIWSGGSSAATGAEPPTIHVWPQGTAATVVVTVVVPERTIMGVGT